MKIAIPVDDGNICVSFGRTPYFMLYDTENNKSRFINNSAANSQGGAGIKAAQIIVDNNADVLITPRCGQNAAEVLIAANVKIYKALNNSIMDYKTHIMRTISYIEENLTEFKNDKLSILTEIHAGFHGDRRR